MGWNGEDQANAALGARPSALPLGVAGPFDRADWFDRLAALHFRQLPRADAFGQSERAAAWLPLVEEKPGVRVSLANWYSFVHRPQFSGARDAAAQLLALTDLCAVLKRKAARLTLYPVPEQDGSCAMLRSALKDAGWWVSAHAAGDSHWLELDGMDYDSWWATRPGELRNTVARKAKKQVVAISIADRFDTALWAEYQRIYAASWKPEEGNAALLRAFAEAEGAAGRLRLGLARIDGAPVAAQWWTVENGAAFIHKLAHVEDNLRASPGTLLTAAMFRHVITEDRVRRVDFGTGNDRYKRDWMNRHSKLWRIDAFNPARVAAWGPAMKATLADWRQQRNR
ncbi:MAG: GNAT family N-acetyltransferase [Sphingopyxis sp.]|nr:GNAT family N-acetyltransferase [Sphingopyxis sp.]